VFKQASTALHGAGILPSSIGDALTADVRFLKFDKPLLRNRFDLSSPIAEKNVMQSLPPTVPMRDERHDEEQEVAWLLERPEISRSANLVRFLTFVCAKYFEGHSEEIRESAIAVEALGRRKDAFDSQSDPIVRVTARTLRKRLDEYYRTEGRAHRVHLALPTGQYVPRFLRPDANALDPAGPNGGEDSAGDPSSGVESSTIAGVPAPESRASPRVDAAGLLPLRRVRSGAPWLPVLPPRLWRRAALLAGVMAACAFSFWLGLRSRSPAETASRSIEVWTQTAWNDEFGGPNGAPPDPDRWAYESGNNGGWGNMELEVYCAPGASTPFPCDPRFPNAYQDGEGNLVLEAMRTPSGTWTSARLKTQPTKEFQYGRLEARLRSSVGAGLWPAVWMLGTNVDRAGWPASGSVTIMENVPSTATSNGLGPGTIRATIHGPGYSGGNGLWQNHTLRDHGRVDDDGFHIYGAIWSPYMIQFYVDDPSNVFCVRSAADVPAGGEWVFNHPFFLVMNLAVGGIWPGPPDAATPNPSRVWVDYVRLYQPSQVPGPTLSAPSLSIKGGRAGTTSVSLNSVVGTGRVYLSCSGAPMHSSCTLNPAVVDFSDMATQSATLAVSTKSGFGPNAQITAPGSYSVAVTAFTVSGDTSTLRVPLSVN
jgi:beta-glucanase (GH16 family)